MSKRFFYLLLMNCVINSAIAQVFQNEWIDYHKTYYKFKVGPFGYDVDGAPVEHGVVRINQAALAAAGLGNISAEQFQLWKDGAEVPMYVSKQTGVLSADDYIEFWGEIANGKPDHALYGDSSFQLSDHWSLESDSAAYFLTVNTSGNNKRFQPASNNTSSVTIPAEKNFLFTAGRYYRSAISQGFGVVDQSLYLSAYDNGEGFTSRSVQNNNSSTLGQLVQIFPKLCFDTTGTSLTARVSMIGNAFYDRSVKILLNNNTLTQFPMGYFLSGKPNITNIDRHFIKNDSAIFIIQNLSGVNGDNMRVATIEFEYPRLFNFGGASTFEFYVDASNNGRYLRITNFNRGNADAVLYDATNGKRYVANAGNSDTLQFLLEPSQIRYHLILVRSDGSTAKNITAIQTRNFTDYSQQINQGDYLIITNPVLYGSGSSNYIQQYADYRSSDSGGHFNVKIVDIHDLEDQFAYGIAMHPLSIKNFLSFARQKFAAPPDDAFLIGKGISYNAYRYVETDPLTGKLNLIPVFGNPGSDNLLSSDKSGDVPATPIGRLSVVSADEVGVYLKKIKQYESAQSDTLNMHTNKLWMKKVLQLAGENDAKVSTMVDSFQTEYSRIISDTLLGANVSIYNKADDPSLYAQALNDFTSQYNNGSALVEYTGHASSTSIDFNLDNPDYYNNAGKYPLFIVNGCLAGNIFDYDVSRLSNRSTLAEKFILEPDRGAIGYLSSSSYTVIDYSHLFTEQFYQSMTSRKYGHGFGEIIQDGISNVMNYTGPDFYSRMHAEQFVFNGDPAIKMNAYSLPDYVLDSAQISISPNDLTVGTDSFTVKININNLGKATDDSVHFYLSRRSPDGKTDTVFCTKLKPIKNVDSILLKLPVVVNRDKGTTELLASVDDDHRIPELSEQNNTVSLKIKISADDPKPVYPYNYSIVNKNIIDLSASAAFDSSTAYIAEIDTTALFNSPAKITRQQISRGGLLTFSAIPLPFNNTVYYWRVSRDSAEQHWNTSSFIYRDTGNSGFEQAHFYQHTQSTFNGMRLDSSNRGYKFSNVLNNLFVQHSVYPTSGNQDAQFSISLNGSFITWSACVGSSVIFNIFNPDTFLPVRDSTLPYSAGAICDSMRRYNFEYSTQTAASRKNAMDFLDNFVPNGYYVVVRKIYDLGNADWAPSVWAKDTALYGHNNSLYHRLKAQGVAIDSFTFPRTFIFVFKKNDSTHFSPVSALSKGIYDRIFNSENIYAIDTAGFVTSPQFGPAKSWGKVKWYGNAQNKNSNITSLDVITTNNNGKDSVWYTIDTSQHELNIAAISAKDYPFIKLRMHSKDAASLQPYQLQDWSVEFAPVAEGAVAPNLGLSIPDTLRLFHATHTAFDTLKGYIVFKNTSAVSFDSLKIKLSLIDEQNVIHPFTVSRTRPLSPGDTLHVSFLINVGDLPQGRYNLDVEVNPDNDQPEEYHFNNSFYQYVYIDRAIMLPVRLVDFTAKLSGKSALLQWDVANELNIKNYEVQFSRDGRTFNTIGNVAPTANTASEKSYSFMHNNITNGKNYYRIKIIDADKQYYYSEVRIVEVGGIYVSVYPNPFTDRLNIAGNSTAIIQLTDVTGKILLQQKTALPAILNVPHLTAGIYIVRINDGVNIRSYKVLKN